MTDEREIVSVVFETSPYGTVDAIVEHDHRAIYFYLNENPVSRSRSGRFGMRACWVRNLELGPHVINVEEMQAGIATMLPRHDCVDPHLQRLPNADWLKVVWLEEGTGAALLEVDPDTNNETVVAVIPPWSGVDGFHGYAANCANPTDVCWPLPDNPLLTKRIDNARQFWDAWRSVEPTSTEASAGGSGNKSTGDPVAGSEEAGKSEAKSGDSHSPVLNPWETRLPEICQSHRQRLSARLEERVVTQLGGDVDVDGDGGLDRIGSNDAQANPPAQWEVPSDHFPLLKILHFATDRHDVLITAGMSICPQPAVEMFVENPMESRRIEIALLLQRTDPLSSTPPPMEIVNQLMGLALYPWQNFTWLGQGHTCNLSIGDSKIGLLLDDAQGSKIAGTNPVQLSAYRGDPVNLLWLIPIQQDVHQRLSAGELTVEDCVAMAAKQ